MNLSRAALALLLGAAVCTSARARRMRSKAVAASCSGVGGPGSAPGATQTICTVQLPVEPAVSHVVHCHNEPSVWPCHAGDPGGASYGAA